MRPRSAAFLSIIAVGGLVTPAVASAEDPPGRLSLAVVVAGEDAAASMVHRALDRPLAIPFALRAMRPPSARPTPEPGAAQGGTDLRLARAQQAYVEADFDACLAALGDDADVLGHLAAGRRATAERLLFWRVACHIGASEVPEAERLARRFVALGLEVPSLVAATHPLVASVLATAREEVLAAPRRTVRVESSAPRAVVGVDGRPDRCVAPCTFDLVAGDHVLSAEADGWEPETMAVRIGDGSARVYLRQRPASPELAAQQWAARWAASPEIDSSPSVLLLARAVRARRLALVTAEREGNGLRLRVALAVDGRLAARGERRAEDAGAVSEDLAAVLRDALVRGRLLEPAPALLARPWFWIAVGATAAVAAAVTAAAVWTPDTRVDVYF